MKILAPHRVTAPLLPLVLALLAASCARPSRERYHDPNMDFSLVRSVAVMPFGNLTGNQNAGDRVRDVFMTMLQSTGAVYVLPAGEVARGLSRAGVGNATAPTAEEVVKMAKLLGVDAVVTGTVREYGEVRSGTSAGNLVSIGLSMMEGQTGRTVWSAAATKGGVGAAERLFGGGGQPMNRVTEEAVSELLDKLFNK